jgi:hypothetical protein
VPFSEPFEDWFMISADKIMRAARQLVAY